MKILENQGLWRVILTVTMSLMALVALWPRPIDQPLQQLLTRFFSELRKNYFTSWLDYDVLEATANVVFFVPLGFVGLLAFKNTSWWRVTLSGFLLSGFMELCQLLFLHSRFASMLDVMTNTSGAFIGALLATFASHFPDARKRLSRRISSKD